MSGLLDPSPKGQSAENGTQIEMHFNLKRVIKTMEFFSLKVKETDKTEPDSGSYSNSIQQVKQSCLE